MGLSTYHIHNKVAKLRNSFVVKQHHYEMQVRPVRHGPASVMFNGVCHVLCSSKVRLISSVCAFYRRQVRP